MLKSSSGQTGLAGLEKKLVGNVPDDSEVPGPVRRSVRLMLAGGALTAVIGVFIIIVTIADRNLLTSNGKALTNAQFTSNLVAGIIQTAVLVAVWVLMARKNREGRGWARFVASGLAVVSTFYAYYIVNSLTVNQTVLGIVYIVANLALWMVGVIAVAFLWRAESSEYFRARAVPR
jgi:hypothetical protein